MSATPKRATVTIRRSGEVPDLPYLVRLTGPIQTLRFPDLCARCGSEARERLPVARAFNRDWRWTPTSQSVNRFRILSIRSVAVPFCDACVLWHRQDVRPVGVVGTVLSLFTNVFVIPLAIAVLAVALYFDPELIGPVGALVRAPDTPIRVAIFALLAATFAMIAWHQTRHRRLTPPTDVTAAFDFSDNLSGVLAVERRVYGVENQRFAQAFEELNRDRLPDP